MTRTLARAILAIFTLYALAMTASAALATKPDENGEHKVTICHRTASDTNPYVFIEVDVASLSPGHLDNADPGHKPTKWKSDGIWRGIAHSAGDPKDDYLATEASECNDFSDESSEPSPTPTQSQSPTPTPIPTPSSTALPTPDSPISTPKASPPDTPRATPTPPESTESIPVPEIPDTAMSENNDTVDLAEFIVLVFAGAVIGTVLGIAFAYFMLALSEWRRR